MVSLTGEDDKWKQSPFISVIRLCSATICPPLEFVPHEEAALKAPSSTEHPASNLPGTIVGRGKLLDYDKDTFTSIPIGERIHRQHGLLDLLPLSAPEQLGEDSLPLR